MPTPRETMAWLNCVDRLFGESQAAALDAVAEMREEGLDLPATRDWPEWTRSEMLAVTAAIHKRYGTPPPPPGAW